MRGQRDLSSQVLFMNEMFVCPLSVLLEYCVSYICLGGWLKRWFVTLLNAEETRDLDIELDSEGVFNSETHAFDTTKLFPLNNLHHREKRSFYQKQPVFASKWWKMGIQVAMYTDPFYRQWFVLCTHLANVLERTLNPPSKRIGAMLPDFVHVSAKTTRIRRYVNIELPKWISLHRNNLCRWSVCCKKIEKPKFHIFDLLE